MLASTMRCGGGAAPGPQPQGSASQSPRRAAVRFSRTHRAYPRRAAGGLRRSGAARHLYSSVPLPWRSYPPMSVSRSPRVSLGPRAVRRTRRPCLAGAALALAALLPGAGCGGDVESRMAEVRALQDVGQFNASIDELREILTVAPDLPEATLKAADRVLAKDKDRTVALQLRAKGNLGAGRPADALVDAQRLIELSPDDYGAQVLWATV